MTTALQVVVARTLVSAVVFDALVPLSPKIAQDLEVTPTFFQGLLAICLTIFAFGQLISTPLIIRLGASRSLTAASTLVALLCLAMTLTNSVRTFAITLLLMFAANALATSASRLWLLQYLGKMRFQATTAYVYGGTCLLATLSPLILILSASTWGWRWVLGALGAALLLVSLGLTTCPLPQKTGPSHSTVLIRLWKQPKFISALLMAVLIQSAFTQLNLSKAFVLDEVFRLPAPVMGVTLSVWTALVALAFFVAGKSVKRFTQTQRLKTALLAQALGAGGMAVAWLQTDFYLYLIAAASTNIAFCILLPLTTAWGLDVAPSQQAQASALFGSVTVAAAGLVTWLGVQLNTPLFFTVMLILGLCALGTCLVFQLLRIK
ncbi:MFS transporter [Pseudomonas sp. MWU13-2517]|uniref:MFS transporter n=1 Tax=Pseudomonas sp. MWU13-2517 TaxID=2929055 RepID=UPI00200DD85A